MATTPDYAEYILQQLSSLGGVTCRKMFGEYGLHCNGKFFACICDNQLLIKVTPAVEEHIPNCPTAPPYEGASPYYLIEDIDDGELLCAIVSKTCELLPEPKPKKKKKG